MMGLHFLWVRLCAWLLVYGSLYAVTMEMSSQKWAAGKWSGFSRFGRMCGGDDFRGKDTEHSAETNELENERRVNY
ncbi:hypothetical protein MOUN0_F00188 [Monosporozyma unispora]